MAFPRLRGMSGATPERRVRLAATLAPLGDPEPGLQFISRSGFEAVQLSASQPGLKPRELDSGARRGLRERLRRLELAVGGLDLWIPREHFRDPQEVARATDAMLDALRLAEDLGRVTLHCMMPAESDAETAPVRRTIVGEAARRGVSIADFADDAVAEGPVRLGVDLAALAARRATAMESIALAGAALGAVRLSRAVDGGARMPFRPGGEGWEILHEVRTALVTGGFPGFPVADARRWPDAKAGLLSTRDAWSAVAAVG